MSDYYGRAKLEDWLDEEVLPNLTITKEITDRFEKWREAVEANIESWLETDDGEGNNLSWRGWGRGFEAIPETERNEFEDTIQSVKNSEVKK